MLFKFTAMYALVAAALATASPVADIAKRGTASCNINVTGFTFPRDNPPPLPAGNMLTSEWTYLAGRLFLESVPPGTPLTVGTANVQGPNLENGGTYHIAQTITSAAVSDEEAAAIMLSWAGRDVTGPFYGVLYHIDNTDCA